jgi:hypothetical protein
MSDPAAADASLAVMEGECKSFLLSRTLWANVVVAPIALWLATHNVILDPQTQAQIVLVFIFAMNVILRKITSQKIVLATPATVAASAAKTGPIAAMLGGVMLLGALGGLSACATTTPAQQLYTAQEAYIVMLGAADAYLALPTCGGTGVGSVCKTIAVVTQIQVASAAAAGAIASAQASIANGTSTGALSEVTSDLAALQAALATLPRPAA